MQLSEMNEVGDGTKTKNPSPQMVDSTKIEREGREEPIWTILL